MQVPGTIGERLAHRGWLLKWRALDSVAAVHRRLDSRDVALTFDDGPHPSSTPRILDVLAELEAPATFFCVGRNAESHPELVRRIRRAGHAVGSHSLTHPHPADVRLRELAREYRDGRRAVENAAGEEVPLFRPPHGHLRFTSAALVRMDRLEPWLWSLDPSDWRPGARRDHIASVAGSAHPGDVVLLHDWVEQPQAPSATDRSATIAAVPEIVSRVRERGLRLAPLRP